VEKSQTKAGWNFFDLLRLLILIKDKLRYPIRILSFNFGKKINRRKGGVNVSAAVLRTTFPKVEIISKDKAYLLQETVNNRK
jgi:hypothetical protein